MKTKKLVQQALHHPELYSPAELVYFGKWLHFKKQAKAAKIESKKKENS